MGSLSIMRLKNFLLAGLLATPALLFAASSVHLDRAPVKLNDRASLQRGAATFVNYCLGCHGASFVRYNRLQDLGISEVAIKENLMFNATKVGEQMVSSMSPKSGREWFGTAVPDLSLVARSRGADWLYTYLRSFYRDASRPTGWNNTIFPNVGMPHVLYRFQGGRELTVSEEHATVDEKTGHHAGAERVVTTYDEAGDKTVKSEKLEHLLGHGSIERKFVTKTPGASTPIEYDQIVADLVNFLTWVGEPAQAKRFSVGVWTLAYLVLLFGLAVMLKRAFWKDIH